MNLSMPARGLNVVPDVTIPAGERAAAMYLYFGFSSAPPAVGDDSNQLRIGIVRGAYTSSNPSIGGQF